MSKSSLIHTHRTLSLLFARRRWQVKFFGSLSVEAVGPRASPRRGW
ncbi:unnamed protein product [Ixodes hexagonus]